jgi:hypothetical protein
MKKLTTDLAAVVSTWMTSDEVKQFIDNTKAATDADTGTFRMVITTADLDRYDEVISLDGWELDHYMKNPVVLWGHNHFGGPVGVTDRLVKEEGKLIAYGRFAPTEKGQELRKLYDFGFLFASSVGLLEKERNGNVITKAELIEWSFVSVPANPYALTLALEKGLSLDELVTKGFMTIKTTEPTEQVPADPAPESDESEDEDDEPEEAPAERALTRKHVEPALTHLKAAIAALEALDTEEPERTDDEPGDETPEERSLRLFQEQKRTLQLLDTTFGEVLAELRQITARR